MFENDFMKLDDEFDLSGGADDIEALFGSGAEADGNDVAAEATVTKEPAAESEDAASAGKVITKEEEESIETENDISEKSDAEKNEVQEDEGEDLFAAEIARAEEKQAESTKNSLIDKPPVFVFANAKEEVADPSITFDKLRYDKAEDFPELDDGSSVSWKMVYGTVEEAVKEPKKTTILEVKKKIEASKKFIDSLKKAKGEIVCKVQPSVE